MAIDLQERRRSGGEKKRAENTVAASVFDEFDEASEEREAHLSESQLLLTGREKEEKYKRQGQ